MLDRSLIRVSRAIRGYSFVTWRNWDRFVGRSLASSLKGRTPTKHGFVLRQHDFSTCSSPGSKRSDNESAIPGSSGGSRSRALVSPLRSRWLVVTPSLRRLIAGSVPGLGQSCSLIWGSPPRSAVSAVQYAPSAKAFSFRVGHSVR